MQQTNYHGVYVCNSFLKYARRNAIYTATARIAIFVSYIHAGTLFIQPLNELIKNICNETDKQKHNNYVNVSSLFKYSHLVAFFFSKKTLQHSENVA